MPIKQPLFSRSKWIWPVCNNGDLVNGYALFRKKFELKSVPKKATLFITADQSYRLFINGTFIGRGPARGFQRNWPYDEIDVSSHLKKGKNLITVRAYNPGFSNFQYLSEGFAGLLVAAKWKNFELVSDASWKSIRQDSIQRDTVPSSMQLFSQEHIDLRKENGDWSALVFDDKNWVSPAMRPWKSAPWYNLEPRNIPLLEEKDIRPKQLVGVGEGRSADGYLQVRDVVGHHFLEDRSHRPVEMKFAPLKVQSTKQGHYRSYLIDFGRTVVGNLIFDIKGASGGEIIDTHLIETVDPKSLTPDLQTPSHCMMAFGDRLICRAGTFTYPFYHHYGFRYLNVIVRDATADFQLDVRLRWIGYPLPRKGSFSSSDKNLEQIWEACAWTQQCCSLDAYVDTPWREQAQWWGDARVQAWNTFHLSGDPRLFRRGIKQIASQTTPDGVTYGHAPTMAHSCILPDFTLIWFLTIWDYYWQTGSVDPLKEHQATIQNALNYFKDWINPKFGLLTYDHRFWQFLDWGGIPKPEVSTVYNLWLLIALEKLARLYRVAKLPGEAAPLEARARKLRGSIQRLVGKDGLIRDGFDAKGKIVQETSIHAQTLGFMAGIKELDKKKITEKIFLPYLRGEIHPKAVPSSYWITYFFSVMIELGYSQEVIDFIKAKWLPMAEHGTTWELFEPIKGETSHSHAWSAHPLYHLMQTVGGIFQAAPEWKQILFRPTFHGDYNRTIVPTPLGPIRSEWKKAGKQVEIKLTLPAKMSARVELPGRSPEVISKSKSWVCREK
jgi:hypothetical protein